MANDRFEARSTRVQTACALLLALPLLGSGGNDLVQWIGLPESDGSAGAQLITAMRDGGLMWWIALGHVVTGLLLLVPRSRFFGGLMQLPISLGILAFNATMFPPGVLLAAVMVVLNVGLLIDRERVRRLF